MPDIVVADVVLNADVETELGVAGETIAAGDWVFYDSVGALRVAYNDDADAVSLVGFATTGGAEGDSVLIVRGGSCDPGFLLTTGQMYYLGDSGVGDSLQIYSDVTSGRYLVFAGYATATDTLVLSPLSLETTKP